MLNVKLILSHNVKYIKKRFKKYNMTVDEKIIDLLHHIVNDFKL